MSAPRSASVPKSASDSRSARGSKSANANASANPPFLAAGQQGCIYDGVFKKIQEQQGCEVIPESTAPPRTITKIMKDLKGYNAELAAARVLAQKDPTMQVAVYATRGCRIQIEDILNDSEIERCNRDKDLDNDKINKKDAGYSIEMPFVEHRTLRQMPSSSVDLTTGIRLFQQLEDLIGTLHTWGIYHKDLHDDNVWVVGNDEDHYSLKIADFGCADTKEPNHPGRMKEDIKTSAPSFKKLIEMIDNRPREVKPETIGNFIKGIGQFYGWNTLKETIQQYAKKAEPMEALELGEPSGKRLRFGSPEGSPPAPSRQTAKKNLMSMFD